MALLASLSYPIGWIYVRRTLAGTGRSHLSLTGAQLLLATAPTGRRHPAVHRPCRTASRSCPLLAVVALGALGTGVALLVQYGLVAEVGPTTAQMVTYFIPVIATAAGVALLGESADLVDPGRRGDRPGGRGPDPGAGPAHAARRPRATSRVPASRRAGAGADRRGHRVRHPCPISVLGAAVETVIRIPGGALIRKRAPGRDGPAGVQQPGDRAGLVRAPGPTRSSRCARAPRPRARASAPISASRRRPYAAATAAASTAPSAHSRTTARCSSRLTQPGPSRCRPRTRSTVTASPVSTASRRSGPYALATERTKAQCG